MRQCLTDSEGGYYTSSSAQFGRDGDFVTSPEISQIFGELVGVWLVAEWMAQGKRKGVEILEVGPGKGTLMSDILRTVRNFKSFSDSIERIYLVEASSKLRDQQRELLCGSNKPEQNTVGWACKSLYGPEVIWCEDIRFIPRGMSSIWSFLRPITNRPVDPSKSPFIIAHEFFDALPIHVFESVAPNTESTITVSATNPSPPRRIPASNQWRELLISPAPEPVPSPEQTGSLSVSAKGGSDPAPEFELVKSKGPTPHSLYLPETSDRYKKVKPINGAVIEISPEAQAYAADFAVRIGGGHAPITTPLAGQSSKPSSGSSRQVVFNKPQPSGAALIFDYGPQSTIPANSLRGIKAHKLVSPLTAPGAVDLSADVDFIALAESAIRASPGIEVHGPVEQGTWLSAMGIAERAKMLMQQVGSAGEQERAKEVDRSWKRLVERGGGGMGKIYKAIAIVPLDNGRRPVGFGGDVFE